ncbi:MAG: hypothetical protein MHM6MM_000099 [Cercozoa sp. M6MM]
MVRRPDVPGTLSFAELRKSIQKSQLRFRRVVSASWSSALSDALLAAACAYAQRRLSEFVTTANDVAVSLIARESEEVAEPLLLSAMPAATGFTLLALAAAVGVLRFGVMPSLRVVHSLLSAVGGEVGIPLIGLHFWLLQYVRRGAPDEEALNSTFNILLVLAVGTWFFSIVIWRIVINAIALVPIVMVGAKLIFSGHVTLGFSAVFGAACIAFAGLLVRDPRRDKQVVWGCKRLDWFHMLLTLGLFSVFVTLANLLTHRHVLAAIASGDTFVYDRFALDWHSPYELLPDTVRFFLLPVRALFDAMFAR